MLKISTILLIFVTLVNGGVYLNKDFLEEEFEYNINTESIYVLFAKLDDIDRNAFDGYNKLTSVYFFDNDLHEFDLGLFKGVPGLRELDIEQNPLNQLTNNNSIVFNNLVTLNLLNTSLIEIDDNILKALPNLTTFSILETPTLKPLVADKLSRLSKLTSLSLSIRNQTSLSSKLFNGLNKLESIYFRSSNISLIDIDTFANLSNLKSLDLEENDLTQFVRLRLSKSLTVLTCARNQLSDVVFLEEIGIKDLDLSKNRLKTFERINFDFLPNLTRLELSSNPIANPNDVYLQIKGVGNALTELSLKEINLSVLNSKFFDKLANLMILDLSSNRIEVIQQGTFSNLQKLTTINLINNRLTQIDNSLFYRLSRLAEIDLTNNSISKLDSRVFANLTSLERVYLDVNKLESIDEGTFSGCTKLKFINLANNRLFSVSPRVFYNLTRLDTIDLSLNNLTRLVDSTTTTLRGFPKLKLINVTGNKRLKYDDVEKLCPIGNCYIVHKKNSTGTSG